MSYYIVPLTTNPNQTFTCTLPVDGKNISLHFTFTYNGIGEYWFMSITDAKTQQLLLDAVPLVTGDYPAADLLGQYSYLGIGSAAIIPASSDDTGIPDDTNLGTEYFLAWTDTLS